LTSSKSRLNVLRGTSLALQQLAPLGQAEQLSGFSQAPRRQ
jgi:hypothetical protein